MKLFAILAAALSVMSASAQTTAPTDFPVPRLSPDTTLYGYEIRIKAYHDANTERSSYDFKESHMIIRTSSRRPTASTRRSASPALSWTANTASSKKAVRSS